MRVLDVDPDSRIPERRALLAPFPDAVPGRAGDARTSVRTRPARRLGAPEADRGDSRERRRAAQRRRRHGRLGPRGVGRGGPLVDRPAAAPALLRDRPDDGRNVVVFRDLVGGRLVPPAFVVDRSGGTSIESGGALRERISPDRSECARWRLPVARSADSTQEEPFHEAPHAAGGSGMRGLHRRRGAGRHRRGSASRPGGPPAYEVWLIDQQGSGRDRLRGKAAYLRRRGARRTTPRPRAGDDRARRRGARVLPREDRQLAGSPAHARLQRGRRRRPRRQHHAMIAYVGERPHRVPRRHHARAGRLHRRGRAGPRGLADA